MHSVSPTQIAQPQRLHGVYLGEEANGIRYAYCYARGVMVRQEPVPVARLDEECAALTRWLDAKHAPRPALRLVK